MTNAIELSIRANTGPVNYYLDTADMTPAEVAAAMWDDMSIEPAVKGMFSELEFDDDTECWTTEANMTGEQLTEMANYWGGFGETEESDDTYHTWIMDGMGWNCGGATRVSWCDVTVFGNLPAGFEEI